MNASDAEKDAEGAELREYRAWVAKGGPNMLEASFHRRELHQKEVAFREKYGTAALMRARQEPTWFGSLVSFFQ